MLLPNLSEQNGRQAYQGILRPLCPGPKSRFHFGVYDIETPGIDSLEFYCCGFFDGEQYTCFYSMEDFLCHVLKKEYSGWRFFAHFGGRFDVHYVFDWLRQNEPDTYMEINCSGSCVISLTIHQGKMRWRFCDSYRLLEASLATITQEFDVKHKKLKGRAFTDREYNEYDCRGLYEVLEKFFDQFDICSETIASHSMRVFRSYFQKRDIYQPRPDIEDFVRRAYYGGRCEIYRYDSAELNHYDINSLYPAAMRYPVPIEYLMQSRELPDSDDRRIGFFKARIDQPEIYLPILPFHLKKLFFPVGYFEGTFTSMELRAAIEAGAKVKIMEGRIFLAEPILKEFVDELYKMKVEAELEGNGAKRYIVKKCVNSNYGKWGQRRDQRTFTVDDGSAGLFPLPNGLAYRMMQSHAAHILPHISAAITSRARLMIHAYLCMARSWYTDTDSLFTDSELPVSTEIGAMKFEGRGAFQAYRLKEYKFADQYKIKGLPRSKYEDPDYNMEKEKAERERLDKELAELYLSGTIVENERMRGWTESVRKGLETVGRVTFPRQYREIMDKRARDGVDTRPWNVKELLAA